jgi:DNA-binding CsgD family transcriptional regulator
MPNKVASEMRERLAAARETTDELERSRSELIRRMHQTLGQLRALRHRLAAVNADHPSEATRQEVNLARKFHLTPREVEVALLLSSGTPNAAIAKLLEISEHTARHHTRHVLVKLGLHSRARAAALIARELGAAAPPLPSGADLEG